MTETIEVNSNVDNAPKDEKIFTQEEVNRIVQKRLHERKKEQEEAGQSKEEIEERELKISNKEKELNARENFISCKEYLQENGHPNDLLEILDTSDIEMFKGKVEKLARIYENKEKGSVYPEYNAEPVQSEPCKSFSNSKHKPKHVNYYGW